MPPSNRKRGRGYRRGMRKARKPKARPTTVVQRGITPIAPRTITRLKYCVGIVRNLSSGIPADNVFRLNSIHDPDFTNLTGTQPYGHDAYAAIYSRYRVFAARYKVTCVSVSTNPANFQVVPTNSTTTLTDYELAREMPRSKSKTGGAQGAPPMIISGKVNLPALNGQTSVQYKADDRFQAQFGTNPSEDLCLHVVSHSPDNIAVRILVEILYFVEMFDPLPLGRS